MIRRLDHLKNLAIVGMSVVVPGGDGINEFGRLVYRGLPMTGRFGDSLTLDAATIQSIHQACGEARVVIERVPVVCLTQSMTHILKDNISHSMTREVSGAVSALTLASEWLESGGEDLVLLVENYERPDAVCAILVADHKSALDNNRPVYALVSGAAEADSPVNASGISGALKEARGTSGIQPESIGLIELATMTDSTFLIEEANGLLDAFNPGLPLTCALGSGLTGLLGVAKTAWCLSQRIIPITSEGGAQAFLDVRQSLPFYIPSESRAWFIPASQINRHAGLNLLEPNGIFAHILFSNAAATSHFRIEAPKQEALHLFPLAANSAEQFLEKMASLQSKLTAGSNLAEVAQETYRQYMLGKPATDLVTCLLGQTSDELLREIGFAAKGVPTAFERHVDWQTPLGSFFTPQPLGRDGKVSFVYPGAFNSYPGVGRDLFYLFPSLYDHLAVITSNIGNLLNEQLLYPRSLTPLTSIDLTEIETRLNADPITMLISGSCLAVLYTDVLQIVFGIHPASAFGYSLGEVSMMFASGVWTEADGTSNALRESPLFRTRLTGPQNAVREYWNLPILGEGDPHEPLWVNYLLMTGPEKVKEALIAETHVYLTHINTPRQVAIGGDPAGCRRVIDRLKCKSLQAPFRYAIHCAPIQSEYDLLTELHSVPVMGQPNMTLYSAATYAPMPIDRQKIAQQIAQELCNCLDFPRLVQLAYNDGARIFIELGAGSNCARWVNDTLPGQPHAAYSINRKGVDDHASILRLLARIVSQQVPVNLSVLYQD